MEGTSVAAAGYQQLPIDKIQPSPYQARKDFNPEELQGLADSMKEEGLIQPIVVRRMSEGAWGLEGDGGSGTIHEKEAPSAPMLPPSPALMYELISGERRLRAAKLLGWPTIEAKIIQTISEAGAAAKGLVEKVPHSRRYRLLAHGYQVCLIYLKLLERIYRCHGAIVPSD